MLRIGIAIIAGALFTATPARAESFPDDDREPDQLLITYRASAGEHELSGVSHKLEWNVVSLAGGAANVRLRIPVASFQSNDPAHDQLLREALDAERFPFIEVQGTAFASSPVQFRGQITIRGVTRPFAALLTLNRTGLQLAVGVAWTLDLEAFGIPRPMVESAQSTAAPARLERTVQLDFSALLSIQPRAVVSGGFLDSTLVSAE